MMTRSTLRSAIAMGLRRSDGKPIEQRIDSIQMAIELAMEMSQNSPLPSAAESNIDRMTPPPSNPEAVRSAPEAQVIPKIPDLEFSVESPVDSPSTSPPPQAMVVLATESEMRKETAIAGEVRVRSLSVRKDGGRKISMEDVASWIVETFPSTITFRPTGVTKDVTIERRIQHIPLTGEGRKMERESCVKLCYRHPKLDPNTMEVGYTLRVGTIEAEGWPDKMMIVNALVGQAKELYKARPAMIEGRPPTGPPMEQAFRTAVANLGELQKRGVPARAAGVNITFGDADEAKPGT